MEVCLSRQAQKLSSLSIISDKKGQSLHVVACSVNNNQSVVIACSVNSSQYCDDINITLHYFESHSFENSTVFLRALQVCMYLGATNYRNTPHCAALRCASCTDMQVNSELIGKGNSTWPLVRVRAKSLSSLNVTARVSGFKFAERILFVFMKSLIFLLVFSPARTKRKKLFLSVP